MLLKKDAPWQWSNAQAIAFSDINPVLSDIPVLYFSDVAKDVVIQASRDGASLMQDGHPIVFASRSLTDWKELITNRKSWLLCLHVKN